MRTSIWYRTEEKNPDKSGYYLTYRGFGMGGSDDSSPHGYLFYSKKKDIWKESEYVSDDDEQYHAHFVYYWTDATPDDWTDADPPGNLLAKKHFTKNVTLEDAWKKVQEAIEQYEILKRLIK